MTASNRLVVGGGVSGGVVARPGLLERLGAGGVGGGGYCCPRSARLTHSPGPSCPGPRPVLAVDTGHDAAALAARQRLALLLAVISDPFLRAVSQLAMAWTLPITGDFDGALREVTVALEEFRGQDEPVFTAMAVGSLGTQVRQMLGAERFDQAFSAGSRLTQREAVAIVRDQRRTGTRTP